MNEDPYNLILELLRLLSADIAAIRDTLCEHGRQLGRLEAGVAEMRRNVRNG